MKVKVFKVRVWTFFRRKRVNSISIMAKVFGRKATGGDQVLAGPQPLDASLVREENGNNHHAELLEEQGPAITKAPTAALSFRSQQGDQSERKSQSKRHMQVITMWNPASVGTTVEAPVESSPKIWLKQASKRWKEHGSGRRLLDPIENGPESSQDWRSRFIDVDQERWPVQGW